MFVEMNRWGFKCECLFGSVREIVLYCMKKKKKEKKSRIKEDKQGDKRTPREIQKMASVKVRKLLPKYFSNGKLSYIKQGDFHFLDFKEWRLDNFNGTSL